MTFGYAFILSTLPAFLKAVGATGIGPLHRPVARPVAALRDPAASGDSQPAVAVRQFHFPAQGNHRGFGGGRAGNPLHHQELHRAEAESRQRKRRDKLIVGVFTDKPPFGFVDEAGRYVGFDTDIGRRFAKDLLGDENKVEFVAVEPASRIPFLQRDRST